MNSQLSGTGTITLESFASTVALLAADGDLSGAASWLRTLMARVDELGMRNSLGPHADLIPFLLSTLEIDLVGPILDRLPASKACRALFGNRSAVPPAQVAAILATMQLPKAASLVEVASLGDEVPNQIASALPLLSADLSKVLLCNVHPDALARLVQELSLSEQELILNAIDVDTAAGLITSVTNNGGAVAYARSARMLAGLPAQLQQALLQCLSSAQRERLAGMLRRVNLGPLAGMSAAQAAAYLDELPVEQAARALTRSSPDLATSVLAALTAPMAALLLISVASVEPRLAADLLRGMDRPVLDGFQQAGGSRYALWQPRTQALVAVVAALDLSLPPAVSMLRLLPESTLNALLKQLPPTRQDSMLAGLGQRVRPLPESNSASHGRRRTQRLDNGLRWTRIEEYLETPTSLKPVVIDLVEMEPSRTRIQASTSASRMPPIPSYLVAGSFAEFQRTGCWPDPEVLRQLGMARLCSQVSSKGAVAAVSGNHAYNFEQHLALARYGIDAGRTPGLFLGDSFGWLVSDGIEQSPPALNNAAFVVNAAGKVFIEKVFMTNLLLAGRVLGWDVVNQSKQPDMASLYNPLFGIRTERGESHVDIAVARGRVIAVTRQGGQGIPLTGFVLSLPAEKCGWIDAKIIGQAVVVGNDFPQAYGPVVQAMAGSAHLVSNGRLVSADNHDWGAAGPYASVLQTNQVESLARSWLMLRDGVLTAGVVSCAPGTSQGMTTTELAQLTLDLEADQALALGSGSVSAIAIHHRNGVHRLGVPAESEWDSASYVNTFWLFHER